MDPYIYGYKRMDPYIYILPPRDTAQIKDIHGLKVKGWYSGFSSDCINLSPFKSKGMTKEFSCQSKGKKSRVAVLIYNKIGFKTNTIAKDKEGYYIMIKGTILQEDIILVNIYIPNVRTPKNMKQILVIIKGEINRNIIIVGDFNTSLTSIDRASTQKINKETVASNNTRWNEFNWYLENIPSQSSRIYLLFKCTWNVF